MKRRIFLSLLVSAALFGAATARQESQAPPDRITLDEFQAMLAEKRPVLILDVRGAVSSKIKGARHIPLDELESQLKELPRGPEVVTYCS